MAFTLPIPISANRGLRGLGNIKWADAGNFAEGVLASADMGSWLPQLNRLLTYRRGLPNFNNFQLVVEANGRYFAAIDKTKELLVRFQRGERGPVVAQALIDAANKIQNERAAIDNAFEMWYKLVPQDRPGATQAAPPPPPAAVQAPPPPPAATSTAAASGVGQTIRTTGGGFSTTSAITAATPLTAESLATRIAEYFEPAPVDPAATPAAVTQAPAATPAPADAPAASPFSWLIPALGVLALFL